MRLYLFIVLISVLFFLAPVYALPGPAKNASPGVTSTHTSNSSAAVNNPKRGSGLATAISHVPAFVASLLTSISNFFRNGIVGIGRALSSWISSAFSPPRHVPVNTTKNTTNTTRSSNSTSSVGATQTGFAPFTATSSSCTPNYFAVSFSAGGFPAGASSATISAATTEITSASGLTGTGFASTVSTTTVTPGSTFIANWTDVKCTAVGVHYSASITMNYTYTSAGLTSTVPAEGTVSGTSS